MYHCNKFSFCHESVVEPSVFWEGVTSNVQGLFLALHPVMMGSENCMLGIESRQAACQANALTAVLSFWLSFIWSPQFYLEQYQSKYFRKMVQENRKRAKTVQ